MLDKIHIWISQRIFLFVILAMIAGYFIPLPNTPALQMLVMVLFGYMTFATGLGTSFNEFLVVSRRPRIPLFILAVVHIVTPMVVWCIAHLFFPNNPNVQMGFLISAMIPVGATSVIWTAMVKGNVPVSLVTVTMDTLLAPLLLPLFILLVVGVSIHIDYVKIAVELLLMITLPSIVGMLLYDVTKGATQSFARGGGGILSKLSFFCVIFLNSAFVTPTIVWNSLIVEILAVTFLVVAGGYLTGYISGRLIHADHDIALAIIYNSGMRNIATGLVVASSYFPAEVAIPITLSMLFQQPLAAVTAKLYSRAFPGHPH